MFLTKVSAFMDEYQMLQNGGRVLVGLSGGADSVALLCLLHDMASRDPSIQIAAVHVNHMLREDAQRDEAFSRELCRKREILFFAERDSFIIQKSISTTAFFAEACMNTFPLRQC